MHPSSAVLVSGRSSLRAVIGAGLLALCVAGCGGGGDDAPLGDDGATEVDAADPDAGVAIDGPVAIDAAPPPVDGPVENWATYRIPVGAHAAQIMGGSNGNPVQQITTVDGRDFRFAFNGSAMYVLTNPVEPTDQLDWNKLPGLSDCGQFDLSVNGAMFGWRWRLDLEPKVLEVTAYANNNSAHLWPNTPLFTLTAAELMADAPLRYRVWWSGNLYHFAVTGMIGARAINASTTISRICPNQSAGALKWAGQFYFGGTSTAPTVVTGRILEIPFAP